MKGQYHEKNPNWPNNYIQAIRQAHENQQEVLISAQPDVLKALHQAGLEFITVTPKASDKDTYLKRYRSRGNDEGFVKLMEKNFEKFIDPMDNNDQAKKHIKLYEGQYLSILFN